VPRVMPRGLRRSKLKCNHDVLKRVKSEIGAVARDVIDVGRTVDSGDRMISREESDELMMSLI
jgi:hypothetical protein